MPQDEGQIIILLPLLAQLQQRTLARVMVQQLHHQRRNLPVILQTQSRRRRAPVLPDLLVREEVRAAGERGRLRVRGEAPIDVRIVRGRVLLLVVGYRLGERRPAMGEAGIELEEYTTGDDGGSECAKDC